jgi:hypothetical protein
MARKLSVGRTIRERLVDPRFRRQFLGEAAGRMLAGDLETAKSFLCEYINGTVGFVALGEALGKSPKSLMRMLGEEGNPQARNLCEMIAWLQENEGVVFTVRVSKAAGE